MTQRDRTLTAAGRLDLQANLAAIRATTGDRFTIEAIHAGEKAARLFRKADILRRALADREAARSREQVANRKPTPPRRKLR